MKRFNLLIVFVTFTLFAKSYDFEADGFYYNILSLTDLTVEVTCMGDENEYSNGRTATYSGDIVIPKTVEYSGRVFSVTEINPYAFIACHIGTLTIHENIVDVCSATHSALGVGDLYGSFEHLIIEDGDTPIRCFRGLIDGDVTETVYLGRNIAGDQGTNIVYGGGSFKEITFGEKVTFLEDVCSNCPNITNVTIPANVKSLNRSFKDCDNLKSVTAQGVETIEDAFRNSGIETIDMPNLKVIEGAFCDCKSLKTIEIPLGVCQLDNGLYNASFENCTNLESIVFPSTLAVWGGEKTFFGCTSLKSITICNPSPIAIIESNFDAVTYLNATLRVPKGALDAYKNAPVWKNFLNIVEDENIQSNVFSVVIDNSYGGYVEIGDLQVKESELVGVSVNKGDKITMKFIPYSDEEVWYELGSVVVDGQDVTSEVVNNELILDISGNIIVDVAWHLHYGESNPSLLTIKQAEGGCTKLLVYEWETYSFFIEPSEGWALHSVFLNGEDITSRIGEDGALELSEMSENTTLSIAFESHNLSAKGVGVSRAKVYATDNCVVISNVNEGESIQIYDDTGLLVETITVTSNTIRVPLSDGIYIVTLEGKSVKVAI